MVLNYQQKKLSFTELYTYIYRESSVELFTELCKFSPSSFISTSHQVVILPYVTLILCGMEPLTSLGFRLQKKIFNLSIFGVEPVDGKCHWSYQVAFSINTDGVK